VLKGGGSIKDMNENEVADEKCESNETENPNLKRHSSASKTKISEDSPPKRRNLISEYKQRTPKKSPYKTPTKRKTPRLRCLNVCCRVGFSTKRAKLHHERFLCQFNKLSADEAFNSSSNTSGDNEKNCRFCDQVFTHARSRVRHEKNQHSASSTTSSRTFHRTPDQTAITLEFPNSPHHQQSTFNQDWKTPKRSQTETEKFECSFCKQTFQRLYRLKLHEGSCTFQEPQTLHQPDIRIPRIKMAEHCEKLTNILGFA
jgi:hypothetical protein